MSDRTPEHRRTAPGQLGANTDPSNPGTCETPLPVPYVEGGEKIAPRASQGVETCPSCGALGYGNATCRTCHAKWVEAWGHQCVFVSAGPGTDRARADAAEAKLAKLSESGVEGWAIRCGEMAKLANRRERERDEARAKLAEIAAALAVSDNDKAVPYEYLTDTVRAVLRDGPSIAVPVTDREEPAQAPEISGAGVPFEQSTGPKRDQCGASSPNGRKQCIRHRGHAGEHMSSVIDTQWASEEPAGETKPDDEHADDCTGCNGPGIVPCAADEVIGRFAYRNGECIKDLEARFGEGLEVVERQADSEAQR